MKEHPSRLVVIASLGLWLGAAALEAACSEPRTPDAATAEPTGADADGGELTCDERARGRSICLGALTQRCGSQQNECEVTCESRAGLPGNTRKAPSVRGEEEAQRCREDCRHGKDACVRSIAARCPSLC